MTAPIQEPLTQRSIAGLQYGTSQLFRRPDPFSEGATVDVPWAMLAIPDGQVVPTSSLEVVVDYDRGDVNGTAMDINLVTGLITINEEGIYDIHSWAEFDDQGAWQQVEGPVFQSGQDYQDIGNGLMTHVNNTTYTIRQHKTTLFVADLPQSVNLQVWHNRGINDDLFNGGLTIVKIGDYPSTSS
jgi:hypothetical protein